LAETSRIQFYLPRRLLHHCREGHEGTAELRQGKSALMPSKKFHPELVLDFADLTPHRWLTPTQLARCRCQAAVLGDSQKYLHKGPVQLPEGVVHSFLNIRTTTLCNSA